MEHLITDGEAINFLVEFPKTQNDAYVEFDIYGVETWDENGKPIDHKPYFRGSIKWDACCNINFGDEGYKFGRCYVQKVQ